MEGLFAGIELFSHNHAVFNADVFQLRHAQTDSTAPPQRPRADASVRLTQEGRQLLEAGNYENAISLLEQATGLNSNNGQSYYYLGQAWLEKGVLVEAKKFNSHARICLQDDKEWLNRIEMQADRISRLEP